MDPSISTVKQKLHQDPTLPPRGSNVHTNKLLHSLSFASKTHTSSSKVIIMNRFMALSWVPPLAPSLPTCLWKSLKSRPLALPYNPCLWLRYVDDTSIIQKAKHSQQLLQHINSQDPNIQFTMEIYHSWTPWFLHFPTTPSSPQSTQSPYTDQYLHWDSKFHHSKK